MDVSEVFYIQERFMLVALSVKIPPQNITGDTSLKHIAMLLYQVEPLLELLIYRHIVLCSGLRLMLVKELQRVLHLEERK